MTEIYLVVSIDTECDKDKNWCIQRPLKFTSVTFGIKEKLMPMFAQYGITPTYLLSPEVMYDDESIKVLTSLENCELGTHLHGEFIEPEPEWNTNRTNTPQLLYHPAIEGEKLKNLTYLFYDRFGYWPTSFRAGRFGISLNTLPFLVALGYKVDSSVTPFWSHFFEGRAKRNYWGASWQPYYPSLTDPRKNGHLSILQVPVTIINKTMMHWPKWLLRLMNQRTKLHKRLLNRLKLSIAQTLWLRPQRSTAEEMIEIARTVVNVASTGKVVLNMMYHNVEVMPGCSPYAQNEDDARAIVDSQETFFKHLFQYYQVKSVGLSQLLDYHW